MDITPLIAEAEQLAARRLPVETAQAAALRIMVAYEWLTLNQIDADLPDTCPAALSKLRENLLRVAAIACRIADDLARTRVPFRKWVAEAAANKPPAIGIEDGIARMAFPLRNLARAMGSGLEYDDHPTPKSETISLLASICARALLCVAEMDQMAPPETERMGSLCPNCQGSGTVANGDAIDQCVLCQGAGTVIAAEGKNQRIVEINPHAPQQSGGSRHYTLEARMNGGFCVTLYAHGAEQGGGVFGDDELEDAMELGDEWVCGPK